MPKLIKSRRSCIGCGLRPGALYANGLCLTCQYPQDIDSQRELDVIDQTPVCEWYALCDHIAVANVAHPILGAVPTCQRCIDKHELTARIERG